MAQSSGTSTEFQPFSYESHRYSLAAAFFAIFILWRLWRFTIVPILYPLEPKVAPYWVPFLGHTAQFFTNSVQTLDNAREALGNVREPFAILVGGATIYVITAASDASHVFKNVTNLTFDEYVRDLMLRFGTSEAGVEAMWRAPSADDTDPDPTLFPNPSRKPLAHLSESIMRQQLHPGERFEALGATLLGHIDAAMTWDAITTKPKIVLGASRQEEGESRLVSLFEWTREVLLLGATKTFFGDALIAIEPELFPNFFYFDDNSWLFTYKIPPAWAKDMYAAKKVVQEALVKFFDTPFEQRAAQQSQLVSMLEAEMRARGICTRDIAALLATIFWVVNGNVYKLCFWSLAYLLHHPAQLGAVRAEVQTAATAASSESGGDGSFSAIELVRRLEGCELLVAVLNETLRLTSSSMAIRNVATPMAVGGKTLRAGTRVIIPFRQMHLNPDVWGANADEFDPFRFLAAPKTKNNATTGDGDSTGTGSKQPHGHRGERDPNFRPFGGGTTYCPGRFIARREALGFIGLALLRFELSLDGPGDSAGSVLPKLDEKTPTIGTMLPVKGHDVCVRVRPVKSS